MYTSAAGPTPLRGVTLIELIVFIAIVSVGLAGLMSTYTAAVRGSADPMQRKQALAIAEALLEEVSRAAFTWCDPADANLDTATSAAGCASLPENSGPEAGNSRPYDNVNDYAGFTLASITDQSGNAISGLSGYSANVAVSAAALNGIAAGEALRVTVTVTAPDGNSYALDAWRTRYAPNAPP